VSAASCPTEVPNQNDTADAAVFPEDVSDSQFQAILFFCPAGIAQVRKRSASVNGDTFDPIVTFLRLNSRSSSDIIKNPSDIREILSFYELAEREL
jgi:hypothetical protein